MPEFIFPEGTTRKRKHDIAVLLWTLRIDGPFEDASGRASSELLNVMGKRGVEINIGNLNTLVKLLMYDDEIKGDYAKINLKTNYIKRQTRSKRTYHLSGTVPPESTRPFPECPFDDRRPMVEIEAEQEEERQRNTEREEEAQAQAEPQLEEDIDDEIPEVLRKAMDKTTNDPLARLKALTSVERAVAGDHDDELPAEPEYDDEEYDVDALIAEAEGTATSIVPVESNNFDQNPQEAFLEGMRLLQSAYVGFSTAPVRDLDALIDQRLGHIASLNDRVQALEVENRKLKVDRDGLAKALRQSNERAAKLQGQLRQVTVGRPA